MTEERRRESRILPAVRVPAKIRGAVEAGILNLSRRGALISTESPLVPGSSYELRLMMPGSELRIPVRVKRCKIEMGNVRSYQSGLEFQDLTEEGRTALEGLVKKAKLGKPVSGMLKAPPRE